MIKNIYLKQKSIVLKILLVLVVITGCNMLLPSLVADVIDKGFNSNNQFIVLTRAIGICLLNIIISLLSIQVESLRITGYNAVQTDLKKKALEKLLNVRVGFFHELSSTAIFQQLDEDIEAISGCFSSHILLAVVQIFITLGMIPILFSISWKLTLLVFFAIPLKVIKSFLFAQKGYKNGKDMIECKKAYSSWLDDVVSGIITIREYNVISHFSNEFINKQGSINSAQYKHEMLQETNIRLEGIIAQALVCLCYILAGYYIAADELSLGEFIAFETYSLSILDFVGEFLNIGYAISVLKPSLERYSEFLQEEEENTGNICCKEESVKLCVKDLSFSYSNQPVIFSNLSLEIPFGSHIALVGNNGSGKTTLINLLLRLYEPTSGKITINGTDVREYELTSYRSLFSVASQKPFLFCDSIQNNICLYQEVSQERLDWAVEMAGLSSLIREKTYSYCVGQNGSELSGGQCQRISLARTLVHWSPVVILDETEANIDDEYEMILSRLMKECYAGRTVIIITHRMEFLKYVDKVYRVCDGNITCGIN